MRKIDNGNKFGNRSNNCLASVDTALKLIHEEAIKRCPVDYGIHQGHRSFDEQLKYFLNGKSRIDPRIEEQKAKSKHLPFPAHATDIHIAEKHNGESLAWDDIHLAFVAGFLMAVAQELYLAGKIDYVLRWGGDWDNDGIIALDHKLKDLPHLELIKPK